MKQVLNTVLTQESIVFLIAILNIGFSFMMSTFARSVV